MDKFLEKLNKLKEGIKLSSEAKAETRLKLLNFIELRPIAPRVRTASFAFSFIKPMPILASVLVFVMAGAGISFAAENSLPGDILYSIKVNLNEELVGALNVTADGKANWEAVRAERRLSEANEVTMANGTSSEEKLEKLEVKFDEHSDKVVARISEMENRGKVAEAVDLATKFETSLKAHEEILEKIGEKRERTEKSKLELKVKQKLAVVESKRLMLESKIETSDGESVKIVVKAAAEGKLKAADNVLEQTLEFLNNRKDKLSVESFNEAQASLAEAKASIAQARVDLEKQLFGEAFNLGNEAIKTAQESKLLVDAKIRLDLNGGSSPVFSTTLAPDNSTSSPTSTESEYGDEREDD